MPTLPFQGQESNKWEGCVRQANVKLCWISKTWFFKGHFDLFSTFRTSYTEIWNQFNNTILYKFKLIGQLLI